MAERMDRVRRGGVGWQFPLVIADTQPMSISATMRSMFTGTLILIGLLVAAFVGMCLLLYLKQDSYLFAPQRTDTALAREWLQRRVEIDAAGHKVEGWWAEDPAADNRAVVLYFGGNSEDVLSTAITSARIGARKLLVTNYRGYGKTPGSPSQIGLFEDALAVYDYAARQPGVLPSDIVVMGRSLGSGVATWIAANRPVKAAILITPYDSILSVASRHYSVFPVRMLLKHPFPSQELAARATAPALMIAAERDIVIPPVHTERLAKAWAGPVETHLLPGMAHNNVEQSPDYYPLINAFLRRVSPAAARVSPADEPGASAP
jgi:pimeloyl-ACP methyl ester carboxylesterase